jgi:hypothetical protein
MRRQPESSTFPLSAFLISMFSFSFRSSLCPFFSLSLLFSSKRERQTSDVDNGSSFISHEKKAKKKKRK